MLINVISFDTLHDIFILACQDALNNENTRDLIIKLLKIKFDHVYQPSSTMFIFRILFPMIFHIISTKGITFSYPDDIDYIKDTWMEYKADCQASIIIENGIIVNHLETLFFTGSLSKEILDLICTNDNSIILRSFFK